MDTQRLAVCSWSLQPSRPADLFNALELIGIPALQIALDPMRKSSDQWSGFKEECSARGVKLVSGMFGTIGEDYSTLDSIKRTGGIVPDEHWEANWKHIQECALLASNLDLSLVTFHAGFIPHDQDDPSFAKLTERIRKIAKLFASCGLSLGFETGQEDAETLSHFLEDLGEENVGVNFDPANMLLYNKGNPIRSLETLAPWLKQCHIKDAIKTKLPGTWGLEVVAGTGEVEWKDFFATLDKIGYQGPLCIEREAGNTRIADILAAKQFISLV
ncbi:MAG: Xylose isomerase domain protein barrel [Verrucomicrobiales bacterium]|nr:Xylose isomerase domain protein barrel [Verrucomicrobiales bacterium]